MTEDYWIDQDGEIHVVYNVPTEILPIPTSEADILDLAAAAALADLEADQERQG